MPAVKSPAAPTPPSTNACCPACFAPTPVMGPHRGGAPALPSGHGPVGERDREAKARGLVFIDAKFNGENGEEGVVCLWGLARSETCESPVPLSALTKPCLPWTSTPRTPTSSSPAENHTSTFGR